MTAANLLAVTAVGVDRPGIVAGVTRVLFELGCNLEDATSTILRGHFSMMLVVRAPEDLDAPALESALAPVAQRMSLLVTARPVGEAQVARPAPTHMVAVYGADRPGIVFRVSELLAGAGANVTDMTSRLAGPEDDPVYALMLEVAVPEGVELEPGLRALEDELGVDVTIHDIDTHVL